MAVSQKSLMERAERLAMQIGTDAHDSPVVDNKVAIETLFPHALRSACTELAGQDESEAANLKRTYELTLTNGVATLPATVIQECLDRSLVYSDDDETVGELSSYQPRYSDFVRPGFSQLGYYTVRGTQFEYREPNGNINTFDGDLKLVAVGIPDIPALLTSAMTISDRVAERTVEKLAQMVRGQ